MPEKPNVVVILVDDMGWSDIGSYGGEINTPVLDGLAGDGVRMSQFYNTARCSPARASLLTGLHPHQTGIGVLTGATAPVGYPGRLNERNVTMAEVLRDAGYGTYHSGKWHLTGATEAPDGAWPRERGFDRSYCMIAGAGSYFQPGLLYDDDVRVSEFGDDYYVTTEIGERAAGYITEHQRTRAEDPLFCYVAFNAPHWPLHAPEDAIARYADTYDVGWDETRRRRHARQQAEGLLPGDWELAERDAAVPAWEDAAAHDWQARRMAVYAAQVELMDAAIGRVVDALRASGRLDNTLLLFLSDNGGCAEEFVPPPDGVEPWRPAHFPRQAPDGGPMRVGNVPEIQPGAADTYTSYGIAWANVSNTPFREYKHWVHEGGIATPLIAHWPAGDLGAGIIDHRARQLPDILATVCDASAAAYPERHHGEDIPSLEGTSMLPGWRAVGARNEPDHELFFEHEGNAAIRRGDWKLVRKYGSGWELYDLSTDRTELINVASEHPDLVLDLIKTYQAWADRVGVIDRAQVLASGPNRTPYRARRQFDSNPRVATS